MIDGYRYCLTMMDRFSRWPEVTPIKDNADTIATGFYATWISRFGAPSTITTDRGTQFESQIFNALIKLIGCKHIRTTAYHPASNGMIERWHRSLKAAIRCHENKNWLEVLPTVMLGLRNSYKENIQATAAEMIYGTSLRLPGEFFVDTETHRDFTIDKFRQYMQMIRPKPTKHHCRRSYFIFNKIFDTSHVFVRIDHIKQPLEQPYEGPYRVIKHISDNVFLIDYRGKETAISTERLKPAYMEDTEPEKPRTYSRQVSSTRPNRSRDLEGDNVVTPIPAQPSRRKVRFL